LLDVFLNAVAIPDDPVPAIEECHHPGVMEMSKNCCNQTMNIVANSPLESYGCAFLTSSSSIVGLQTEHHLIVN